MEKTILSREELYRMVWAEPMSALAKRYNISDVGLRKICIRMNIPLPKHGHWVKVRFGKSIKPAKLPAEYSGDPTVTLHPRSTDGTGTNSFSSPMKALLEEIRDNPDLPLKVPDRLTKPDGLIIEAKHSLTKVRQTYSHYPGMVNTGSGELNIRVAPANIGRALRFMDTLIKLLRARGHNILVSGHKTCAVVFEQQLEFCLKEKVKLVKTNDRWGSTQYQPTGILTFRLERFLGGEWRSGTQMIEDQLARILVKLEIEALREKEERRRIDEWHQKMEEERRIEQERKARIEKEMSDFKNLINQAKRLQLSAFLREYIDVVEERARSNGEITAELQQWLEWARGKADWYDPLVNAKDILLGDADKFKLTI